MELSTAVEVPIGFLLVLFVPGYAVTKALFPEWRIRGPEAYLRLIEIATLGFVLSVVLTVLVGYVLLVGAPSGFQAYWSAPVLEAALAGIALVAVAVGAARGAYARVPPPARAPAPSGGEEGAWELTRELDRLAREERQLLRSLRGTASSADEAARLRARLEEVRAHSQELGRRREAEYAE
jgi:hypothetical protein